MPTQRSPMPLTILLCLLLVAQAADMTEKKYKVQTTAAINQNNVVENRSVCFADCESCQSTTGDCEKCFSPWYELRAGKCELAYPEYKLESTDQEQRFNNFIASSEWSYNGFPTASRVCTPNPTFLTKNFTIIGPFGSGNITYQRTISQHNYFGMKFLLVLSNWTSFDSSIRMRVTNEAGNSILDQTISFDNVLIEKALQEQLCSASPVDRRVSVSFQMREEQSSELIIQFTSRMAPGASWGLSSFVLITGQCDPKCALCDKFIPRADGCLMCKNFLANNDTTGQKCNTCLNGFALVPTQNRCQKCPIELKQCRTAPPVCQYSNLTNANTNCNFIDPIYFDNKQLIEQTFFGSLYTVQNKGAMVTKCGAYSIVGPANFGEIISRTFLQLPAHIKLSLNFNIFIFQQKQLTQRYSIIILINGQPIQINPAEQTINITGSSSECDLYSSVRNYEAMKTFETQSFFVHKKMENVVVGVSLGTSTGNLETKWGVRDIRLVFKRCDENCEVCTDNGCQKCKGFFQLKDLECSDCLVGTGNVGGVCQPCTQNCVSCNLTNSILVCTKCMSGYYLYTFNNRTTCELNPTYGQPVLGRMSENGGCSVTIPGDQAKRMDFDIVQNRATRGFNFPAPSVKKNIQFNLMKIDNWQGDYLDIYANDLLVKRLELGGAGSNYCGNQNEGDQIFLQQFEIDDNSTGLNLEFEAVQKDTGKTRRFGVGDLRIYPVGCTDCKNYDFLYRVKYNYDERLFAELGFNLVYENNNPEDFKNIFKLKAGDRYLDYEVSHNDSIRYWLKSERIQQGEVLEKNLAVQCRYPERVTAQIPLASDPQGKNKINRYQFFDRSRLLQSVNPNYQTTKIIDNTFAKVLVDRYSPLRGREESVLGLQTFFSVLTRIVVYLGFASFFIGCQTPCTHVMHNFQKIWIHIYVASLALSPIFKTALWGFREAQDQNIAINPDQWESGLPRYLYYEAPAFFQHYYHDITFFRHIYNVGVAFAILALVYLVFHLLVKRFTKTSSISSNVITRHLKTVFQFRPLFFFNSIIFYQYFTVCIACCLQFLDLKTRTNEPAFAGVNAAAAIIAFIFVTLYPIIFHYILHRKRGPMLSLLETILGNNRNKELENHRRDLEALEEEHVIYNNKYSQIFYRIIPKKIWSSNIAASQMFSQKHLLYNIFRFGQLWWHAIVAILLYHSPFAQAFLLILTNGFHLALNTFASLNTNKIFRILKSLQLLFFIVIEIMIIVMLSLLKTLRFQSYETLGIVAIIFVFFLLLVTFARFLYTVYRLYREYRDNLDDDPRKVIRCDKGFRKGWFNED